jgi:hypothetical protein
MAREHGKWFAQRKSLVRVFTHYNIARMGVSVGSKSHDLIDILSKRNSSSTDAIDIQALFFQVRISYVLVLCTLF